MLRAGRALEGNSLSDRSEGSGELGDNHVVIIDREDLTASSCDNGCCLATTCTAATASEMRGGVIHSTKVVGSDNSNTCLLQCFNDIDPCKLTASDTARLMSWGITEHDDNSAGSWSPLGNVGCG